MYPTHYKPKNNFKKFLMSILSVALIFSCANVLYPSNISKNTLNETVSAESVADLVITSESDLKDFADKVNSGTTYSGQIVALAVDLHLSGKCWTPIGSWGDKTDTHWENNKHKFQGTFDGCGHTIYGLTINDTLQGGYAGLFGAIREGARIQNLNLVDVDIKCTGKSHTGGIVARGDNVQMINCSVTGTISSNSGNVGGLVGSVGGGSYQNSYSYAKVNGGNAGGLIGCTWGETSVSRCFYYGTGVTGSKAGAIFGYKNEAAEPKISDVYKNSVLDLFLNGFDKDKKDKIKTNDSAWITDTEGLMGQGTNAEVLKGVGNICAETEVWKFNTSNKTYAKDDSTVEKKLLFSTVTGNSSTNKTMTVTPEANQSFYGIEVKKLDGGYTCIDKDGYRYIAGSKASASYHPFTATINSNRPEYKEYSIHITPTLADRTHTSSAAFSFQATSSSSDTHTFLSETSGYKKNDSNGYLVQVYTQRSHKYKIGKDEYTATQYFPGNYKIIAYQRGKLLNVQPTLKTYKLTSDKKITELETTKATHISYDIKCNCDINSDLDTKGFAKYTADENINYVPYNETYTISFKDNDISGYVKHLRGFKLGSRPEVNDHYKSYNGNFSGDYTADTSDPTFYFDNIQFVDVVADGPTAYKYSGIFSSSTVSSVRSDYVAAFLIGEPLSTSGLSYYSSSNNTLKKAITTLSPKGTRVPVWGGFYCEGIYGTDAKGTEVCYYKNGTNGVSDLTCKSTSGIIIPDENTSTKANCWYCKWGNTTDTYTINFTNKAYIDSASYSYSYYKNTTDTQQTNVSKNLKSDSAQTTVTTVSHANDATFKITPAFGYKISSIDFTTQCGEERTTQKIDLSSVDVTKDYDSKAKTFEKYYRDPIQKDRGVSSVSISYRVKYSKTTSEYEVVFARTIGVVDISFNLEARDYSVKFSTDRDSTVYDDTKNMGIDLDGNKEFADGEYISKSKTVSTNIKYGETKIFDYKIRDGYKLNGTEQSGAGYTVVFTPDGTNSQKGKVKVTLISYDGALSSVNIKIKLSKIKTNLKVVVEGLNVAYDGAKIGLYVNKSGIIGGNNLNDCGIKITDKTINESKLTTTSAINELSYSLQTDQEARIFIFNVPSYATLKSANITATGCKPSADKVVDKSSFDFENGNYLICDIDNFAHPVDGETITVTIKFELLKTKVNIKMLVGEEDTSNIRNDSEFFKYVRAEAKLIEVTIGTEIIIKDLGTKITVGFVDFHSAEYNASKYSKSTDANTYYTSAVYSVSKQTGTKAIETVLYTENDYFNGYTVGKGGTTFRLTLTNDFVKQVFNEPEEFNIGVICRLKKVGVYVGMVRVNSDATTFKMDNVENLRALDSTVGKGAYSGDTVLIPNPEKEFELEKRYGYYFSGYRKTESSGTKEINPGPSYFFENLTEYKITADENKDGSDNERNYYFIAVFKAKKYTVNFITNCIDNITKEQLSVELLKDGNHFDSDVVLEFGKKYTTANLLEIIPYAQIDGMYDFAGWNVGGKSELSYINNKWNNDFTLSYSSASVSDNKTDKTIGTVDFDIVTQEKVITIEYYQSEDASSPYEIGYVDYSKSNYRKLGDKLGYPTPPTRYGYKFVGFVSESGVQYITYNPQTKHYSGVEFNEQLASPYTVKFYPVWEAIIYDIKYNAGGNNNATFGTSSKTELSGKVTFDSYDYSNSELFNADGTIKDSYMPTWKTNYATYKFLYFKVNNDPEKIVYANGNANDSQNYILKESDLNSGTVILYAYYELVEFVLPTLQVAEIVPNDNIYEWKYDGELHGIVPNFGTANSNGVLVYTYDWYQKDNSTLLHSGEKFDVKNVKDSGVYYAKITATVQADMYATGEVTLDSDFVEIIIDKADGLYFYDAIDGAENIAEHELKKVFDNTTNIDFARYKFVNTVESEKTKINMSVKYKHVNVQYKNELDIEIFATDDSVDLNNYQTAEYFANEIFGTITQYEFSIVLVNHNENSIFQNGDTSYQIDLTDYYKLSDKDILFASINDLGTISFKVYTSKNIVGEYSFDNNSTKLVVDKLNVPNGNIVNFTAKVEDNFKILQDDENLMMGLNFVVKTNDIKDNETVDSSIAVLKVSPSKLTRGDGTSSVSIKDTKDHIVAQKDGFEILLILKNKDYYVSEWKVIVDNKDKTSDYLTSSSETKGTLKVVDPSVSSVCVYVYVSTLINVNYDYRLAEGETLNKTLPTKTNFALNQKISSSISVYSTSNFPYGTNDTECTDKNAIIDDITRKGWKFTGWVDSNNNKVTSSTSWTYVQNTTLYATWEQLDLNIENLSLKYNEVYDGLSHNLEFNIINLNTQSLTYTYTWTPTNVAGVVFSDAKITVKDVKHSGKYSLTVKASYIGGYKEATCEVEINITPFTIFDNYIDLSKQYDKSAELIPQVIAGANGEEVTVSGKYFDFNALSKLDFDSLKLSVIKDAEKQDSSNYYINKSNISTDSQILPKEITLEIGENVTVFDRTNPTVIPTVSNTFEDNAVVFSYVISTPSPNCDIYYYDSTLVGNDKNLIITLTGDKLENFKFTVNGYLEIRRFTLTNSNITWIADPNDFVFNGKVHSFVLEPSLTSIVDSYVYYNSEGEEVDSVIYAGSYVVKANIKYDDIIKCYAGNFIVEDELTHSFVIEKRAINISYNGALYSRVYDGTSNALIDYQVSNIPAEMSDEYKPEIEYSFIDKNIGTNKPIIFVLSEDKLVNDSYTMTQDDIVGSILPMDIKLDVNLSKQYDGTGKFVVGFSDIQFTQGKIVDVEKLSGELIFDNILNVNEQPYTSGLDIKNNLMVNNTLFDTNESILNNYNILEIKYSLMITKAELIVSYTNIEKYVYSGSPVAIIHTFARKDGQSSASKPTELNIVYTAKDGATLDGENAVQVGQYSFEIKLADGLDSQNYTFTSTSNTKGSFEITQRDIVVLFTKQIPHPVGESKIVYAYEFNGDNTYKDDNILAEESSLGDGDTIYFKFETKSSNVGSYPIKDQNKCEIVYIKVYKSNTDYSKNYNIVSSVNAVINIIQTNINIDQIVLVNSSCVYNGDVQAPRLNVVLGDKIDEDVEYTILNATRLHNGQTVSISTKDDFIYAGKYEFKLELANFSIVNNGTKVYEIKQKDVEITFDKISKIYDGTEFVDNNNFNKVEGLIQSDIDNYKVMVQGKYSTKDVGTNLAVEFSIVSSNQYVSSSYNLKTLHAFGDIEVRKVYLNLKNQYIKYYDGEDIDLDISLFNVVSVDEFGEIVGSGYAENQHFEGKIIVHKNTVGNYNLLENANIIEQKLDLFTFAGEKLNITNYEISYFNSNTNCAIITWAEIAVNVSNLEIVYNDKTNVENNVPQIEYSISSGHGQICDDMLPVVEYYLNGNGAACTPKNAGVYTINFKFDSENSNYKFVYMKNGELFTDFEFTYDDSFEILKRQITFDAGTINRAWIDDYIIYNATNKDIKVATSTDDGLVEGHLFTAQFKTNGKDDGHYTDISVSAQDILSNTTPVYMLSMKIEANGQDVTDNYLVVGYSIDINVTAIDEEFDKSLLSELVYDSNDKVEQGQVRVRISINKHLYIFAYGQDYSTSFDGTISMTNLKYNNVATNKVIDAGTYTMDCRVEINEQIVSETIEFEVQKRQITSVNFEINDGNKQYDAQSNVLGQINSSLICNSDVSKISIKAYYVDEDNNDTIIVGSHKLRFVLEGNSKDCNNYDISNLIIQREITKRTITLAVKDNFKLVYNGQEQSIQYTDLQLSAGSLVDNEVLNGSVKFLQKDAGNYDFINSVVDVSNLVVLNKLSEPITEYYEILFNGRLQIAKLKATMVVNSNLLSIEYNGLKQNLEKIEGLLTINNITGDLLEEAIKDINISYNIEPINAGDNYKATVNNNSNNFSYVVLDYTNNEIAFEITKRQIEINVGEKFAIFSHDPNYFYETEIINSDVQGRGLVLNHQIVGIFKFTGNIVAGDRNKLNQSNFENNDGTLTFDIQENGVSVLDNYEITKYSGYLTINPFEIQTIYLKETELVYNGTDAVNRLTVVFIDKDGNSHSFTKADTTTANRIGNFNIPTGSAINANVDDTSYTLRVAITNCVFADNNNTIDLQFKITPLKIESIYLVNDKQYDGTALVYNSNKQTNLVSNDVLDIDKDKLIINGYYVDSDGNKVSKSNKKAYLINFELDDNNGITKNNYQVAITSSGMIIPRELELLVDAETVYSTTGYYAVDYNEQNYTILNGSLVSGDSISGYVSFIKTDYVGIVDNTTVKYDLSNLMITNADSNNNDNYLISVVGQVDIKKVKISVQFDSSENKFTYSNEGKSISVILTLTNSTENLPSYSIKYVSDTYDSTIAPKNIGTYVASIIVDTKYYEFENDNTFSFEIVQYLYTINKNELSVFTKNYGESDPELNYSFNVFNETVIVNFTRTSGEEVGYYDIQINSCNNKNYLVEFEVGANKNMFQIKKAGKLKITILETDNNKNILKKTFDAQNIGSKNIESLDYKAEYNVNGTSTDEVVEGVVYFKTGVDVGEYDIASWELTSDNFESFEVESEIKFVINPKPIKVRSLNATKSYDGTTSFIGTIDIIDSNNSVLDPTLYLITATGEYEQKDVGDNIKVNVSFANDNLNNYTIDDTLTGSIQSRKVKVSPNENQSVVYGTSSFDITYQVEDMETTNFAGSFENEISGNLFIELLSGKTKFIAGTYTIKNGLTSSNLQITFVNTITFEIQKKELTVSDENNLSKIFDGNYIVDTSKFSVSGLVSGDEVNVSATYYDAQKTQPSETVGLNKIVVFTLTGTDAENYFVSDTVGSITSKTVYLNFDYSEDDIFNGDLITNNDTKTVDILYGVKVSDSLISLPQPMHEGYEFAGWYLNKETQITLETLIDSPIWLVSEDEKTIKAHWEIKSFDVSLTTATKVNGVYVVDTDKQGGTVVSISKKFDYCTVIDLTQNNPQAKTGYEFVGYATDLYGEPSIDMESYVVNAQSNTLFAKFNPLIVKLTINANGGNFEKSGQYWTYNDNLTEASIEVEFNTKLSLTATLPSAIKDGYSQVVGTWKDSAGDAGNDVDFGNDSILDTNFYPTRTLFVKWEAQSYDLTLDANGGYFEEYDENWEIVSVDANDKVISIKKKVVFDKELGTLPEPTKHGWKFDSYTDNISSTYVWNYIEPKIVCAKWEEITSKLTIVSVHGDVRVEIYSKDDVLLNTTTLDASKNSSLVIDVSTTNYVKLTTTTYQGYEFEKYVSDITNIDNVQNVSVVINEFLEDQTVSVSYLPRQNTITIQVNDMNRGYVECDTYSTEETGITEFYANTETLVKMLATAYEGYEVASWEVEYGDYACSLSGKDGDIERTLSDFVDDVIITVNFVPSKISIKIVSDSAKGLISLTDGEKLVENVDTYTTQALRTESGLVFKITTEHGYNVDTVLANWKFETSSENKGIFTIEQSDNVYTITFKGFTKDGTITVPFVNIVYTTTVVAVKFNTGYVVDSQLLDIATLTQAGQQDKNLDSYGTFTAEYLTQVKLVPNNVITGYTFVGWSKDSTTDLSLTLIEGLVTTYKDLSIDFKVLDNRTIYLIYEINEYRVKYSVSDKIKGNLQYSDRENLLSLSQAIKYNENAQVVKAVANEHFNFIKWVQVIDGEYIYYSSNSEIKITNITKEMQFVAIFEGDPITITINLTLNEEDVIDSAVDFASMLFYTNDGTTLESTSNRNGATITYTINTSAGEIISMRLVEKQGYEFSSTSPFISNNGRNSDNQLVFTSSILYEATEIDFVVKAKENIISFTLKGEIDGAEIYEDLTNSNKVTQIDRDGSTLKIYVKTGGKVGVILNIKSGYKLITTGIFTPVASSTSSYTYVYEGIVSDDNIDVEIDAFKYNVKFDYNYDGCEQGFETSIKFAKSKFDTELTNQQLNPERVKYRFVAWNTSKDGTGTNYYIDDSKNIYTTEYINKQLVKNYGFIGSTNSTVSMIEGVDYECTLFAVWELITYKVDVKFVPNTAVNSINVSLKDMFPNIEGRNMRFGTDENNRIIGISYTPESSVQIVAPMCYDGYIYVGWAYEDGITDKQQITQGIFNEKMPENDIVVYLYYGINVSVTSNGNGSVEQSDDLVLYGGKITVSATPDYAYLFNNWIFNGTKVENSKEKNMQFEIKVPTEINANFVGEVVNVEIEQTENARLEIANPSSDNKYRVGDTINFVIKDLTYGYYHKGWDNQFAGQFTNFKYTIVPEDVETGTIKFKLIIAPKTITVDFVVDGGIDVDGQKCAFVFDNVEEVYVSKKFSYNDIVNFGIRKLARFELVSLYVNDVEVDISLRSLKISKDYHFVDNITNTVKLKFNPLLWVDVYEMFTGTGTENDPYRIFNEKQLAAVAYLINNNISSEGKVPYAKGYYVMQAGMRLTSRFWQPIGTEENPFDGTFDFADNTIYDLFLDKHYNVVLYDGLFGYTTENAKFLTTPSDFTSVIIVVASIVGGFSLIAVIIVIYLHEKRKKMRKLSTASSKSTDSLLDTTGKDDD